MRNWRRCRSKRWICRWNRRRPRDERRRDNQSNERHERGRWRQKQQQLQLRINQQNKKWGKDALVVSAGGDGARAHLAASAPQL